MKAVMHEGLTMNPHAALPSGKDEIGIRDLLTRKMTIAEKMEQLSFKMWRRNLLKMQEDKRYRQNDGFGVELIAQLSDAIYKASADGKRTVAVLAPWHEDITLSKSEGYIRRIKEIDYRVLEDAFCVYFYECPYYNVDRIIVDRISEGRYYVRYNARYDSQRKLVEEILGEFDVCYSHSILRVIPNYGEKLLGIFGGKTRHVLDLHGAVVEESEMQGNHALAEKAARAEKYYFDNIDCCIVLTDSMRDYLCEKYGCENVSFLSTPVLSADISGEGTFTRKNHRSAVYAGGCQPWQNIELMQSAIRAQADSFVFSVFVSSPEAFREKWGTDEYPGNLFVKNGKPDEIMEKYSSAQFGFILRDDVAINRVACPTKLMEYIQFGIIPVLKFDGIGDFRKLGLSYVGVDDFIAGRIPDEEECRKMAEQNYAIIKRLKSEYAENIKRISTDFIG